MMQSQCRSDKQLQPESPAGILLHLFVALRLAGASHVNCSAVIGKSLHDYNARSTLFECNNEVSPCL